jgi:hypothetical protein
MAGIKGQGTGRARVKVWAGGAAGVAGWGAKVLALAGSASARSAERGRLINKVSPVTDRCARSAILP